MDSILHDGKSIREFENNSKNCVFPDAVTYPDFFKKHLVHPSRRLKAFIDDPNANIRAFYFQYLILCFEVQNNNVQFYLEKLHSYILDPDFSFIFLEADDETIFNDKQFKKFFLQFLQILQSGQFLSVEEAINKYPIADIVFVYFFRTLLIYGDVASDFEEFIHKEELFEFLLRNFSIDAAIYEEKCLKFFETQVFVYEENPQEVYIAYIEIDKDSLYELNEQQNEITFEGNQIKECKQVLLESEESFHEEEYLQETRMKQVKRNETELLIESNRLSPSHDLKKVFPSLQYNNSASTVDYNNNIYPPVNSYKVSPSVGSHKLSPSIDYKVSPSGNSKQDEHLELQTFGTSRSTTIQNFSSSLKIQEEQPFFYDPKATQSQKLLQGSLKSKILKQLDISHEFTDSILLNKVIDQPYRQNIRNIKSRSRQYRESLVKGIK